MDGRGTYIIVSKTLNYWTCIGQQQQEQQEQKITMKLLNYLTSALKKAHFPAMFCMDTCK